MPVKTISPYPLPSQDDYPESRVGWSIAEESCALLVHDMQQYFLNPYDLTQEPLASVLRHLSSLVTGCRAAGIPVIFSAQPGEQDRAERGLLWDMWGQGITAQKELSGFLPELSPKEGDTVLEKRRYSAFFGTGLDEILANECRRDLLITGVYGHIGCLATATDGFMRGVRPFLVADAIADFSHEDHLIALRQVARTCGAVTRTRLVLDQLRIAAA